MYQPPLTAVAAAFFFEAGVCFLAGVFPGVAFPFLGVAAGLALEAETADLVAGAFFTFLALVGYNDIIGQ